MTITIIPTFILIPVHIRALGVVVMMTVVSTVAVTAAAVAMMLMVMVAIVPRRVRCCCCCCILAAALCLHVRLLLPLLLLHSEASVPVDAQPPALEVQPLQLVVGVARLLVGLVRHERAALPVPRPLVLQEALLRHPPKAAEELAHLGLGEGVGNIPHKEVAPPGLWGWRP